jgi:8-oxo-dGTP pyrophosphatase MutT (NUDIX family)
MVAALQTIVDERDGSWQANVAREALEEAGIDA